MAQEKETWLAKMGRTHPDFELERVPQQRRLPFWALFAIFLGFQSILAPTMAGAGMSMGLPWSQGFWAIIIGVLFIAVFIGLTAWIAYREGFNTGILLRNVFGHWGYKVPLFILAATTVVWFSLDMFMIGTVSEELIGHVGGFYAAPVFFIALGLGAVLYGIHGPKWVAYATIPFMVIVYIWIIVYLNNLVGGWQGLLAYEPIQPFSMAFGIQMIVGIWIASAMCNPDFTRFTKSKVGLFAYPLSTIIMIGLAGYIGAMGWVAVQGYGLAETVLTMSGPILIVGLALMFLMVSNNAPETQYSYSIEFGIVWLKTKHLFVIILAPILLIVATIIRFVTGGPDFMFAYMPFLVCIATPLVGVVYADYWLLNKGHYPEIREMTRGVNGIALACWVIGSAVNYWTSGMMEATPTLGFQYGIPGINGAVVTFILYWILFKAFRLKPLEQLS